MGKLAIAVDNAVEEDYEKAIDQVQHQRLVEVVNYPRPTATSYPAGALYCSHVAASLPSPEHPERQP